MPRSLRLPSGPQRLALAEGHDGALFHPDIAPQARWAEREPGLLRRMAAGSARAMEQWALEFGKADAASDTAASQDADLWAPEIPEWADTGERTAHGYTLIGNIALIEIEGVLMARGFHGWWSGCYWPGYRDYVAALKAANDDDRVDAVLIRFDTPGGYVTGCGEAAQAIRALRAGEGGKPIVGHASELCCSAGMKLAAQCDVFYASDGAMVGSVGVRIGFFDIEGALERWGERSHVFKSGEFKDMGSPFRAPTEAETALYQAEINHLADRFYRELAAGRDLDLEALREHHGWEAKVFTAADPAPPAELDPLAVDLIDGVMSEADAFALAQTLAQSLSSAPALSPAPSASQPQTQTDPAPRKETTMSTTAKIAALKAKAEGGDAKAKAELDDILALIGASASADDDDAGEMSDDDAESEGEDDDAEGADDADDDAEAEGDAEDDAEALADAVLNHKEAKGREALAGKLAVKVASGKETLAGAVALLKASARASGFRDAAATATPGGVRRATGQAVKNDADASLVNSAKKMAGIET